MSKVIKMAGHQLSTDEVAEFLYTETRDKNYQSDTGCAYGRFCHHPLAAPGTPWDDLTSNQKMQAMAMSLFHLLALGDDVDNPIVIVTPSVIREFWCPCHGCYGNVIPENLAKVFERVYTEVETFHNKSGRTPLFENLTHEQKMREISPFVSSRFEEIVKELLAVPSVHCEKYQD